LEARYNLGIVLQNRGQFAEAVEILGGVVTGFPDAPRVKDTVIPALKGCKELLALSEQLPELLRGEVEMSPAGQSKVADVCRFRKLYANASRLYAEAFARQPGLLDDESDPLRYEAAWAAVLAGCDQGHDAFTLDAKERGRWRGQALKWLRAELT